MMKRSLLGIVLLTLIYWVVSYLFEHKKSEIEVTSPEVTRKQEKTKFSYQIQENPTLLPQTNKNTKSLHAEQTTSEDDLLVVKELLRQYRKFHKGANPIGFNDEITAALRGRNDSKIAIIAPREELINERGELLDRYGTPYRFHAFSSDLMEVASAGPDKEFFTEDDMNSSEL